MVVQILLLIAGFVFLIGGASWLVDGASSLARRLKISDLAVGLTVVAFGTSCPELFVNIMAALRGDSAIAIGNILGSNSFNILVILGIASLMYPLAITPGTVWKEIPFSLLAAVLLGIMANDALFDATQSNLLDRVDGLVFLAFFVLFLYYIAGMMRLSPEEAEAVPSKSLTIPKSLLRVAAGLAGLVLGARWVVSGAVFVALRSGVSEGVIAFTLVAAGTSLPELVTSVVAAVKKKPGIAVGNVVGSNIFNIFFVLGITPLIRPLEFSPANRYDIALVIFASVLLFVFMFTGKNRKLDRWEGALLLGVYAAYLVFLFVNR
jgi:cation:H+ antiporter